MALTPLPPDVSATLAELTALPPAQLEQAWATAATGNGYRSWTVPRGDGRVRRIDEPVEHLKHVQSRVLDRILYRAPISPLAHGFVPGRSVVTNAQAHLPTATALLSVDLADAFPSTSWERVRRALTWGLGWFFRASYPRLDKAGRARLFEAVADLCCHRGALPQGAPTSGVLLNMACASLDRRCTRLVRQNPDAVPDLRYTRYADDLTFTASRPIPDGFRHRVIHAVEVEGYRVNPRKVEHYAAADRDLVVCGVRLHDGGLTLPRATLRRYRALLFQALAYEPDAVPDEVKAYVHGALGFLTMVCPECPKPLEGLLHDVLRRHGAWVRPPRRRPSGLNIGYTDL